MHLIDGKTLAEKIRAEVTQEIREEGLSPHLAVLLVGEDPASHLYVSLKEKTAKEMGIRLTVKRQPVYATDEDLINVISSWNRNPDVHAILVQLPLPIGHNTDHIISSIDPEKDVDGFHPDSIVPSPTHEGILRLINQTPLKLTGTSACLIANSETFAAPLEQLLTIGGMFVHVLNPDELDLDQIAQADLIVIAVGRPHFLQASMTRPDAVIIDVGTNKTPKGKVVGDVDGDSFEKTDVWISPVPGGVGPMTVAQLMKNVVRLLKNSLSS